MVAAPVAREIYRRIYNLRGYLPETYPEPLVNQTPRTYESGKNTVPDGQLLSSPLPVVKADLTELIMPDLKGMSMRMSLSGLYALGLKPVPHGSGRVIRQSPAAGKHLPLL